MKKNVWILNHYAGGMLNNKGGRHYWLAKYLKRAGYEPTIFCANTMHGVPARFVDTKNLWIEQRANEIGVPFVLVRSSLYKGNGTDRVRNMLGFYRNVQDAAIDYAKSHECPDIIYASSVHPLTLVAGIKLAKRFGVKCICEVRDLWPETLFAYSNRLNAKGALAKALYRGEKWIYTNADALIFTMEGGPKYIVDKCWDTAHGGPVNLEKVFHINNGVDLEANDMNVHEYVFDNPEYTECEKARIVYAGSIRRANNIGFLVDVAECLKDDPIDLFIFGDGDERDGLIKESIARGVDNIHFMGRVEKRYVPSILARGMMMMMMYSQSQSKVSKYGMSQNKLFEYLASGKAIISNLPNDYSVINRYECGIEREFLTPKSYADAIREALARQDTLARWGKNARKAASIYSFEAHAKRLVQVIESLD